VINFIFYGTILSGSLTKNRKWKLFAENNFNENGNENKVFFKVIRSKGTKRCTSDE